MTEEIYDDTGGSDYVDLSPVAHAGAVYPGAVNPGQQHITINVHGGSTVSGVAAVLSFVIPGLGQIYQGKVFRGFLWLVIVVIGYFCFVIPGIILHVICVFNAAMGVRRR